MNPILAALTRYFRHSRRGGKNLGGKHKRRAQRMPLWLEMLEDRTMPSALSWDIKMEAPTSTLAAH
jgi:hypothetical protein